ncbi:MAG TPA: Ig-like domain-containing protein [Gemmatimonadaceae bacterium]|nr:Ig-like domain-containing protein [Gemmatimonadaceae bacterium]
MRDFAIIADSGAHRVGETIHFSVATNRGGDISGARDVQWSSSDTSVIAFTAPGAAVARSNGTAIVKAFGLGGIDSMTVVIGLDLPQHAPVAVVSLEPEQLTLAPGDTATLTPTVLSRWGFHISDCRMTWSISDSTVAKVTAVGLVTALAGGTATVTAQCDGHSGSSRVEVQGNRIAPPDSQASAPKAPDGPTGNAHSGGGLLSDIFSQYRSDGDLRLAYLIAHNPELLHLDRSVQWNGHATMRYDQPGGTSASPQVHRSLPHSLRDLWFRGSYRFSPGWSTKGSRPPSETAEAYKWFAIGWAGGASQRLDVVFTNTDDIYMSAGLAEHGKTLFAQKAQVTSDASFMWDGGWYTLVVHAIAQGSTVTMEMWLQDQSGRVRLHETVSGTTSNGRPVPAMNRVALGMNFNDTRYPGQSQSLWLGEWEVVDGARHPNPFGVR